MQADDITKYFKEQKFYDVEISNIEISDLNGTTTTELKTNERYKLSFDFKTKKNFKKILAQQKKLETVRFLRKNVLLETDIYLTKE